MYEITYDDQTVVGGELYHHGRKGQRWGEKNGPPYPLNRTAVKENYSGKEAKMYESNTNAADSKSTQKSGAKQKIAKAASTINLATKSVTTAPKQVSGHVGDIKSQADEMTQNKLNASKNRVWANAVTNAIQKQKEKAAKKKQDKADEARRQKEAEDYERDLKDLAAKKKKSQELIDKYADEAKTDRQKKLESMSAAELYEHASEYSSDELKSAFDRIDTINSLKQKSIIQLQNENAAKREEQASFKNSAEKIKRGLDIAADYASTGVRVYDAFATLAGQPKLEDIARANINIKMAELQDQYLQGYYKSVYAEKDKEAKKEYDEQAARYKKKEQEVKEAVDKQYKEDYAAKKQQRADIRDQELKAGSSVTKADEVEAAIKLPNRKDSKYTEMTEKMMQETTKPTLKLPSDDLYIKSTLQGGADLKGLADQLKGNNNKGDVNKKLEEIAKKIENLEKNLG